MSAALYWKGRLIEGRPFYSDAMYVENVTFKPSRSGDIWPHSVNRIALYDDYCIWFRQAYLPEFQSQEHYTKFPEDLPRRADELNFFATIGPWVYVVGKQQQVRSYVVMEKEHQDGAWFEVRKKRYFIRFCSIEAHRAAFQLFAGMSLGAVELFDVDLAKVVAEAQVECRDRITKNRVSTPNVS